MKKMKKNLLIIFTICIISLTGCKSKETRTVIKQINSIGEVTLDSKNTIDSIAEQYYNLEEEDQENVNNYDKLSNAYDTYYSLYAEDYDKRVEDACKNVTLDNENTLYELKEEYSTMDSSAIEKVQKYSVLEDNIKTWEGQKASAIYAEVAMAINYGDYDMVYDFIDEIKQYKQYLSDEEVIKDLVLCGQCLGVYEAITYIKDGLKSPDSFNLYDLSVGTADYDNGEWCSTYTIKYGATNSFGAEVTSTSTIYTYYTIDTDKVSVDFTHSKLSPGEALRRALNN